MSVFDTVAIISFLFVVFFIFFFDFLYKKLKVCFERIKDLERFNEKTFEIIQDLANEVSQYRKTTENIQDNQNNLDESFKELKASFRTLKETATELQSAHQTKKAVLDLMKR